MTSSFRLELLSTLLEYLFDVASKTYFKTQKKEYVGYRNKVLTTYILDIRHVKKV